MMVSRTRSHRRTVRVRSCFLLWLVAGWIATQVAAGPVDDTLDAGRRNGSASGLGGPGNFVPPAPLPAAFQGYLTIDRAQLDATCGTAGPESMTTRCPGVPGGIAHVAAGTGLRNRGSGMIPLRGAPLDAEPVFALLYVGVLFEAPVPSQLAISVQGRTVTADLFATNDGPCWTIGTTRAAFYRASVLDLVPPAINGDYRIEGVPSGWSDGRSPYIDDAPLPYAQGASLVVGFAAESVPDDSVVYVHETSDGTPVLIDQLQIDHGLALPVPAWSSLRFTSIGGDGQVEDGGVGLDVVDTDFGSIEFWFRLRGDGSVVEPVPDWLGTDGGHEAFLWDTRTTELLASIANEVLPASSTTYSVLYSARAATSAITGIGGPPTAASRSPTTPNMDCVNVAVHVLTVCGQIP